MHVLIPYALCDDPVFGEAVSAAMRAAPTQLPHLQALMALVQTGTRLRWPDLHPIAPHEHWLALARGLDPAAPQWAAMRARELGLASDPSTCWAFMTPAHWELGQTRVSLRDPAELALTDDEAQALRATMAGFFAEDGLTLHADRADRWLISGEPLRGLVSASPERVTGRDVGPWLPESALLKRLQSEMQMLLYNHAVNDARSARGAWVVNGYWLHGMGSLTGVIGAATENPEDAMMPVVWDELREPALRLDATGWLQTWQVLDAKLSALAESLRSGQPASLTLCGDHHLHQYIASTSGWWTRLRRRLSPPVLSEILVVK